MFEHPPVVDGVLFDLHALVYSQNLEVTSTIVLLPVPV
jgi:hypothetical protein